MAKDSQLSQTSVNKCAESLSLPSNKLQRLATLSQEGISVPSFSLLSLTNLSEKVIHDFLIEFDGLFFAIRPISKPENPLVRTVLNVGFTDETVKAFGRASCDERLAYDCYRRFIETYADLVDDIPDYLFEEISDEFGDSSFSLDQLKSLCESYKQLYEEETGKLFPQSLEEQFLQVTRALKENAAESGVEDLLCVVQKMVFGNASKNSCSGLISSRYTNTGKKNPSVKYQLNAQSEDLIFYPELNVVHDLCEDEFLSQFQDEINYIIQSSESAFKSAVEISFVVESGKLYLLNCHELECSPKAKMLIAHDFVKE
ncbi:MAG: hypothetical protein NE330_11690, partial [Lentisphaeraceae bacterium]|nr:hypothetical protein [Lentisphaeraceae bacterium]